MRIRGGRIDLFLSPRVDRFAECSMVSHVNQSWHSVVTKLRESQKHLLKNEEYRSTWEQRVLRVYVVVRKNPGELRGSIMRGEARRDHNDEITELHTVIANIVLIVPQSSDKNCKVPTFSYSNMHTYVYMLKLLQYTT